MDLEERLNHIDYEALQTTYRPSQFAFEFINFIKLVNGGNGEENKSPLIHYDMLDQVTTARQNLFVSFRGSAKCLSVDTNIMSPAGLLRLEDIAVGDVILDRNGVPTEVIIASDIFKDKPCYRIELANGHSFVATDDHVHFVERRTQNAERKNVWVEEQLTTSEIIAIGRGRKNYLGWSIPTYGIAASDTRIVDIVPVDPVPTKCIGVASDTHSYITEGGYITHNTSALHEYMILYLATYGEIPDFGEVNVGMYISDTIDNGVKSMRTNLEHRWNNSDFLQKYVPTKRFTDVRWEFTNADGKDLCFRGFGASPLALDEVVHTPHGAVAMEDIKVGDKVYGSDGKLANVVKKSRVFHKDMYRITLRDGRSLRVSYDHLNSVYVKVDHKFVKKVLTTEDILKKSLKLTGKNEYRYAVPMCSPVEYPNKNLEVDPYTLGLMLGDGRSRADGTNNLTGCVEDLEFYKNHIPYEFGVLYEDNRLPGVGSLTIKDLYKGMKVIGMQGCITYDKFIPSDYKTASVTQRLELIKGLMDTDGTIYGNSRVSFTNTSKQLVDDVKGIIESLGGYTSIKTNPANTREFRGYCSECRESYTLSIFISVNVFKLPRKADKFKINRLHDKLAITSIEKIEQVPSQCIGLDNDNHEFVSTRYFVTHNTGVRGFKEYGQRPTWLGLDDLMSDKNAESNTITKDIKHIIYKAARQAMHPRKRMTIWTGTPFNKSDPLYEAAGSKAWNTRVYPIAEKFPCTREEFRGGWDDRFNYDFVKGEYDSLLESGEIQSFNQELMLRITSDEDRLVQEDDLVWYSRSAVFKDKSRYNFYITTDLATSTEKKSDFSVISVWAYNNNGTWMLVDGICKRQLMDMNINDLFRFCSIYKPLSVGIEINGQQKGFVSWIKSQMIERNIFFNLAKQGATEGIRRTGKKIDSFKLFVPTIKAKKMWLPEEMKETPLIVELLEEVRYATGEGFKSKHDDVCDTLSMLLDIDAYRPSAHVADEYVSNESGTYGFFNNDDSDIYKNSTIF